MATMLGIQVLAYAISRQNDPLIGVYLESLDPEPRRVMARGMLYSMLALDDGRGRAVVPDALLATLEDA